MPFDVKKFLKEHAYQNVPLWYDQAYQLGTFALQGCAGDDLAMWQSIAILSALHNRATYAHRGDGKSAPHSAAEQIAGICAAIFAEDIGKSEFGFAHPDVPFVMDNSGMGGDLVVTANVSTLASLIAATAGINMCKHGSPANADSGRHGSSDFIRLCGIDPYASREDVERSIKEHGFGYTEALDTRFKRIHLQTHMVAHLPHMNDIIGPVTNPVHPSLLRRRVIGVNHLVPPAVIAEVYQILNKKGVTSMEHLYVVRGKVSPHSHEGFDEISICTGGSEVAELIEGEIRADYLVPADFGINPVPVEAVSPPLGVSKGDFSLRILQGEEKGAARKMVLANAALLFLLDERGKTLASAYRLAEEVFESGQVPELVSRMKGIVAA